MANKQKQRLMHQEFGHCQIADGRLRYCQTCCNYQLSAVNKGQMVCIAYGDVADANCQWDPKFFACGMYNRPFRLTTPKRRTLLEARGKGKEESKEETCEIIKLF